MANDRPMIEVRIDTVEQLAAIFALIRGEDLAGLALAVAQLDAASTALKASVDANA